MMEHEFSFLKGALSEIITVKVNVNGEIFKNKFLNELKTSEFKYSNVDLDIHKVEGENIFLQNRGDNIFISIPERKSAYIKLSIHQSSPTESELKIKIRPNVGLTILSVSYLALGLVFIAIALIYNNYYFVPTAVLLAGGLLASLFGQIAKRNLYGNFNRVRNKILKA